MRRERTYVVDIVAVQTCVVLFDSECDDQFFGRELSLRMAYPADGTLGEILIIRWLTFDSFDGFIVGYRVSLV